MEIIREEGGENISKGYLALPFNEDQFKTFITGLLGRPQVITKSYYGRFELYLKDIQNFHDLLDQRITQQNNGKLVQLRTKLFFSDESTVSLGSYSELITYNEVRSVQTEAVQISWTYLIQFADKEVPEKQEIDIVITTNAYRGEHPLLTGLKKSERYYIENSITVTVSHTARTWGFDIVQLLKSHINSLLIEERPIKKYIRKQSENFGLIIGLIFLLGSFTGIYLSSSKYIDKNQESAEQIVNNASSSNIDKLNYLIDQIASQGFFELKTIIYVAVSLILSIIVMAKIMKYANFSTYSYIVMTRKDKKNFEERKKSETKEYYYLAGTIVLGIVLNVVSNWIYDYLAN